MAVTTTTANHVTTTMSRRTPTLPTLTLEQLMERVKVRCWKGTSNEATAVHNAEQCISLLGKDTPAADVDEVAIDDLIERLAEEEGNANSTVNRKLAALSRMLRFAYQRGQIPRVPHIERLKEPQHRTRFFSPREEAAMMAWCDEPANDAPAWFRHLIVFLMYTGLRRSEALALRWDAFGGGFGTVTVWQSKGGTQRTVPLSSKAGSAVETMWQAGSRDAGPWTERYPVEVHRVWERMRAALASPEDDQYVLHALRHTFCSRLVQRGVDLYRVKELAGHRSIETTLRYAHLKREDLEAAVAVLE